MARVEMSDTDLQENVLVIWQCARDNKSSPSQWATAVVAELGRAVLGL